MANHKILESLEFVNKYRSKLIPGSFKFITKAYRSSDNTVAIFPKENDIDCYFQLPSEKRKTVPGNRRYVYKLSKETISNNKYLTTEDGRYLIPVADLLTWDDPYNEDDTFKEETIEKNIVTPTVKMKPSIILIDRLAEAEARVEKVMLNLNNLAEKGEEMISTLNKAIYGNKN